MRTPILIRGGSPLVLRLNSQLHGKMVKPPEDPTSPGVWVYTPPSGLYRNALIDVVGVRGDDFLVNDDKDHGDRTLKIWANSNQDRQPAIEVSANHKFTITTLGKLHEDKTSKGRRFEYRSVIVATGFSYLLTGNSGPLASEINLDHLLFSISRSHPFAIDFLPDAIRWLAFGAGAGLAAGWLLRETAALREPREPSHR